MKLLLTILFLISFEGLFAQCEGVRRNQGTTAPGEIYRPSTAAWQPGDTIVITPTSLSVLEIYGGGGTYDCPIVIIAATSFHADAIRFKGGAHNFKVYSDGGGLDTTTTRSITCGNFALDKADHIEANGLEISGGNVAFYNKMNVSYADQSSWYPNFPMTGNKLIGCFVHDIGGEAVYSGLTQPSGYVVTSTWSGLDTTIVGNISDSVEIAYNYIIRSDWDGIQLSHGPYGNSIHHNVVRNYGLLDISNQRAGIIMGGNCNGDVYNNTVVQGTGNGIEVFGFGEINVYNNTLDSTGTTSEGSGDESVYLSYRTISYWSPPVPQINFYNNSIGHPRAYGAIRNTYSGIELPSTIINNTFCIPGATGSWQSTYLILDVPGTTNTNNTLNCSESCNCIISNIKFRN